MYFKFPEQQELGWQRLGEAVEASKSASAESRCQLRDAQPQR